MQGMGRPKLAAEPSKLLIPVSKGNRRPPTGRDAWSEPGFPVPSAHLPGWWNWSDTVALRATAFVA
jgi:hypothetical protein